MSGHQYLTPKQRGIVKRYYAHRDAIYVQQLQQLVSDLALEPESGKLWKKAETLLRKVTTEPPLPESLIQKTVADRSVERLAEIAATLDRGG